jgi:flagellar FliL protein
MATSAIKSVPKPPDKATLPTEETTVPPARSPKKKILLISAAVLALCAAGGAAWYYLNPVAPKTPVPALAKPPVYATLDTFTVNLTQEGGEQFLQIGITLLVADQAQSDLIKLYMPMVRNRLLTLLSNKKAGELSSADGKQKLAEEIKARLQIAFVANSAPPVISNVLFTSFVIQ